MSCTDSVCGTGGWTGPKPGDPDNNVLLSATGVFGGVEVSWSYPSTFPYAVAHTLVYKAKELDYTKAIQVAVASGNYYFDRNTDNKTVDYYYWISIVSVNGTVGALIGPAKAQSRPPIATVIEQLSGQIEESALGQNLRTALGNITLNKSTLDNEIANRIGGNAALAQAFANVQNGITQAIALLDKEVLKRTTGQDAFIAELSTQASVNQKNSAAIFEEKTTRVGLTDALALDVTELYTANDTVAAAVKTIDESKIGYSADKTTEAPYDGNGSTVVYNATAYPANKFPQYSVKRARIIDKVGVDNWNATAAGIAKPLVWLVGLPLAQAIKTIGISDGGTTPKYLTFEERATAQKKTNGDLEGQYSIKIDAAGRVAGFGLSNTVPLKGTGTSRFIVNADTFSVSKPYEYSQETTPNAAAAGNIWFKPSSSKTYKAKYAGTTGWVEQIVPTISPFIVDTTTGEVLINNAAIKKLNADSIDTRGLSIKDTAGNIILAAGTNLDWSNLANLPAFAPADATKGATWGTNLSGIPALAPADATKGATWGTNITRQPTTLANINTTEGNKLGGIAAGADVTSANTAAAISGQGSFATLSQITVTNASTYIADLAVNTLQIAGNAVSIMDGRNLSSDVTIPVSSIAPNWVVGTSTQASYFTASNSTEVLSFTLQNAGVPFMVSANAMTATTGGPLGYLYMQASLFINGTSVIYCDFEDQAIGGRVLSTGKLSYLEKNPASGNSVISLRVRRYGSHTEGTCVATPVSTYYGREGCWIYAIGLKK